MHTGDRALVESVYGVVENISGYVQRAVDPRTGLVTSLPSTNVYYDTPVVTRLNVLGANVFRRTASLGAVLGRPQHEIDRQQGRQAAVTAAVNRWLTRPDGTYVDGLQADGTPSATASQSANACAAAYGVVPAAALDAVGRYVSSLGMQATPQNAGEVLRALALAGRTADLVALLTDAGIDGWANILARGATFTWEVWNPSDVIGDSMSHGWGATMVPEIQRSLLGVRPTAPGFAAFSVSPPPAGLDWALGSVPTPRGTVSVAWRRPTPTDARFSVDVEVPPNSTATVTVPADRAAGVTEGGRPLQGMPGILASAFGEGIARLELGAGTYRIRSGVSA
jgi:alpha-L-rhamnosidase